MFVGRRLVELQDDVDLKEAIDTYEHVVRRLLSERKSAGMCIDACISSCLLSSNYNVVHMKQCACLLFLLKRNKHV